MESKTVWLAVACLLVGGFAGYWYAGQAAATEDEYLQKNIVQACIDLCGPRGCIGCFQSIPPEGPPTAQNIIISEGESTKTCTVSKVLEKIDGNYVAVTSDCVLQESEEFGGPGGAFD